MELPPSWMPTWATATRICLGVDCGGGHFLFCQRRVGRKKCGNFVPIGQHIGNVVKGNPRPFETRRAAHDFLVACDHPSGLLKRSDASFHIAPYRAQIDRCDGMPRCDVLADRPRLGGVESMAHPPPTVQSQDPGGFVGKLQTMQCVFWYHPRAFAALYRGTQQIGIDYPMDLLERNSCYASCFICQQYRLFGALWPSGTNITGLNDGFQYE